VAAYDVPVQAGTRTKNTCMESRHIPTIQHRHTYTPSMTPRALGPYPLPQTDRNPMFKARLFATPLSFLPPSSGQLSGERRVMLGLQSFKLL
jgi:hypothetical protein